MLFRSIFSPYLVKLSMFNFLLNLYILFIEMEVVTLKNTCVLSNQMTSQGGVMLMFRVLIVEKIRWFNRKVL